MMAVPMDLWAHKGDPLGLESCQSEYDTGASTISNHSYCQARNRHCDYFITTTHPHSKIKQNSNYKCEVLLNSATCPGQWTFWPLATVFLLLGLLSLFLLLLLAEEQNIHTITICHTHIENYTVTS